MNPWTDILLGGFGAAILLNTGLLIYHLGRINATLLFIHADLTRLGSEFEKHVEKDSEQFAATWKRIDELRMVR